MMIQGTAGRPGAEGFLRGQSSGSIRGRLRRRFVGEALRMSLDPLEPRVLLSGSLLYVNDNWHISADTGAPGLSAGDTVDNTGAGDDGALHDLTFGSKAFSTLSGALAVAVPGDRVVLVSGAYSEDVTVTGGVSIEGWSHFAVTSRLPAANPDGPHLNQGALNVTLMSQVTGVHWAINDANAAESVNVLGLNFLAIPAAGAITVVSGNKAAVTLSNNAFSDTSGTRTAVQVIAGSAVQTVHIQFNTFTEGRRAISADFVTGEISGNEMTGQLRGIEVSRGENLLIANNSVAALQMDPTVIAAAILTDGSGAGVVIAGNQIGLDPGRYGIVVSNTETESVTVSGNAITDPTLGSIGILVTDNGAAFGFVNGRANARISTNDVTGTKYGIALDGSGTDALGAPLPVSATITGNVLAGCINSVLLQGISYGTIAANAISGAIIAVDVEADSGALISNNSIGGSGRGILYDSDAPGTITGTRFDLGLRNVTDMQIAAGSQLILAGGDHFGGTYLFVDNLTTLNFMLAGDSFGTADPNVINTKILDKRDEVWRGLVSWVFPGVMVGEHVFYGHSSFDVGGHDTAIASDKTALLPGGTATFANYTSYDRGLNGIMVDLSGTVASNLSAADFIFKTGNNNSPDGWSVVTAVPTVTVRPGAGVGGSTRVEITFADGAIRDTWLQVTVLGNARTDMLNDAVFYFGNAVGESGDSANNMRVDMLDQLAARGGATGSASITNPLDFNRDGVVDGGDEAVARGNMTWFMSELHLLATPTDLLVSEGGAAIAESTTLITTYVRDASLVAGLGGTEAANTAAGEISRAGLLLVGSTMSEPKYRLKNASGNQIDAANMVVDQPRSPVAANGVCPNGSNASVIAADIINTHTSGVGMIAGVVKVLTGNETIHYETPIMPPITYYAGNVYRCAASLPKGVLWEDGKIMRHPFDWTSDGVNVLDGTAYSIE